MRKIKLKTWEVKNPEGKDVKESLLSALSALLGNKPPQEMPRGIDNFRLFSRLSKAFRKAEDTKILILEDSDYSFLKNMIEKDIPGSWGFSEDMLNTIEEFLKLEPEK